MVDQSNIQLSKEDLVKLKADLIKWLIGTKLALAVWIIYLMQ